MIACAMARAVFGLWSTQNEASSTEMVTAVIRVSRRTGTFRPRTEMFSPHSGELMYLAIRWASTFPEAEV